MAQDEILTVFREMIFTIMQLAAPLLLVSLSIGLMVSIFQAATQINEQTLTFVPKVAMISLLLLVIGPWMLTSIMEFFVYIMDIMARV